MNLRDALKLMTFLGFIYFGWKFGKYLVYGLINSNVVFENYEKSKLAAIIVPYRNRSKQLTYFLKSINSFLIKKGIDHLIIIVNQTDNCMFNRGQLINIGYIYAKKQDADYMIFHDVDLLPLDVKLNYKYPQNGPFHISDPMIHPVYHYSKFLGGVLSITLKDFEKVNGMSNLYWGWGREDDDFRKRLEFYGLKIIKQKYKEPTPRKFIHIHEKLQQREKSNLNKNTKLLREENFENGLRDLNFKLLNIKYKETSNSKYMVLNIKLHC